VQESVLALVIGRLPRLLESNEVDDTPRAADVYQFHGAIVDRVVVGEQIQVTGEEDDKKHLLRLEGNASCRSTALQTQQQHHKTEYMGKIASEAEDIHAVLRLRRATYVVFSARERWFASWSLFLIWTCRVCPGDICLHSKASAVPVKAAAQAKCRE
jgi:hypothetical protein